MGWYGPGFGPPYWWWIMPIVGIIIILIILFIIVRIFMGVGSSMCGVSHNEHWAGNGEYLKREIKELKEEIKTLKKTMGGKEV